MHYLSTDDQILFINFLQVLKLTEKSIIFLTDMTPQFYSHIVTCELIERFINLDEGSTVNLGLNIMGQWLSRSFHLIADLIIAIARCWKGLPI